MESPYSWNLLQTVIEYDKTEKETMAFIRGKYKFTEAADKALRGMVAKAGGAQAKRTKAMKVMKK